MSQFNEYLSKRHSSLKCTFVACIALVLSTNLSATQSEFSQQQTKQYHEFSFSWKDNERSYQLAFALDKQSLNQMPTTRPAFSNPIMQRHMQVALIKIAKSYDVREARVSIRRQGDRLHYSVKSRDQGIADDTLLALQKEAQSAKALYLKEHFYTPYTSPTGSNAIKHDHARYAVQSALALSPLVEAIKAMQVNVNDSREFIAISLSWIQSIPYDTLENRISSNGAGFVSPKDLLQQNKGDCDSKATLFAALLRAYSSSVRQKMVLLPEHALLAVAIRPKPEDVVVTHDGVEYVLLEAVGPGYFAIGEVGETTLMGIRNRQYSLETM